MKKLIIILFILLIPMLSFATEKEEKLALLKITKNLKLYMNNNDIEKVLSLYHKDSGLQKSWQKPKIKQLILDSYAKSKGKRGQVESIEIILYEKDKNRFIIKTTLSKKGIFFGHIILKKELKQWLIFDLDMEG